MVALNMYSITVFLLDNLKKKTMKKLATFILLLIVLGGSSLRAQLLNPFTDQLVTPPTFPLYYWPSFQFLNEINGVLTVEVNQNNVWVSGSKYIITKDQHGFFTNYKFYEYDAASGEWVADIEYESENTYNANGQLTGMRSVNNQDEVQNITYRTLTYQSGGQYAAITGLDSMYNSPMWSATPFFDSVIYNASGKIIKRSVVSTVPGTFALEYRINMAYNASGQLTEALYQYGFMGMFQDWNKFVYAYNAQGQLESIQWFEWEESSSSLQEEHRDSLYYPSANQKIHVVYERDDLNNLVPEDKGIYTYDNSGNLQNVISYEYINSWVLLDSTIYHYGKGRPDAMAVYGWTGSGWSAQPIEKGEFLDLITGISSVNNNQSQLVVSPNPVSDFVSLDGLKQSSNYEIEVLKVDGATVYKALHSSTKIDLSFLPAGIYLMKVTDNQVVRTAKFVKN